MVIISQNIQILSLGLEDLLEEEMAAYSSILAKECYGQRSLVGYTVHGGTKSQR